MGQDDRSYFVTSKNIEYIDGFVNKNAPKTILNVGLTKIKYCMSKGR